MSYALRHGAVELGLPMRGDGYVRVDALLKIPGLQRANVATVRQVVEEDKKNRYSLADIEEGGSSHLFIRANQGHSIAVNDEELLSPIEKADDLPICIHATNEKALEAILKTGLSKMGRNHIHFTTAEKLRGEARPTLYEWPYGFSILLYFN
mmetsp:Transcript_16029/g.40502  ORF Transcript_16029/g.40502 Transcript_16029/m.40502 type:complete len:152 (-) Transcript_16029:660-1115(-)